MFLIILIIYYIIGAVITTSFAIITKTYVKTEEFVLLSSAWPLVCVIWCLYTCADYLTDFIEEQIDKRNSK